MNSTKERANGKWYDILSHYIDAKLLDGKHHGCPICGNGRDKFRYDDKGGNGSFFCNTCGAGSGIHLLSQHQDCSHAEAWKLVDKVVGSAAVAPKKDHTDQLQRVKNILETCNAGDDNDFVIEYMRSRSLTDVPESLLRGFYWLNGSECHAMIAKAAKGSKLVGVHATFIRDGVKVDRRMYAVADGAMVGSALRLQKLNGGDAIVIGEGIETSLSAGKITGLPAWAAMDAGKLEKVEIPDQIRRVVIAADNDASFTGQAAAYALAKRLKIAGKSVEVIVPITQGEDWNDYIRKAK